MNISPKSNLTTFSNRSAVPQVLFVTRDREQLCPTDGALEGISCEPYVVSSISYALSLSLGRYSAIVLDELVIGEDLADVLDAFARCAPEASLLVACDAGSWGAIVATLGTCCAQLVLKPLSAIEMQRFLRRLERQHRVRRELEDSLHFIRRVADATPEMLYLFDIDDQVTIYVNRQLCSVLGCTPAGIAAEGLVFFGSVIHHDDSNRVTKYLKTGLQAAMDGDVVQCEYRIRDRRHQWRWIHTREIVFLRDDMLRPRQILGTAQDISDRKDLEQTQALLAAIVESSNDAIIGKTLGGEILSWNQAAERIYGYTAKEAIGQNVGLLVPAEQNNELPTLLAKIRRGERVNDYRTTRRKKDGALLEVSITISPIKDRFGQVTGASTIAREL